MMQLRLEKVVASKQFGLTVETEEERRAMMQLPNGSGWPWSWMKKEKQDWRDGSYIPAQFMLDMIKGVVKVGVVWSF